LKEQSEHLRNGDPLHQSYISKIKDRIVLYLPTIPLQTNATIEDDFIKCNNSIYVGTKQRLNEMYVKTRERGGRDIYYGKDNFLPEERILGVNFIQWDRLHIVWKRFAAMIQSDIYYYLRNRRMHFLLEVRMNKIKVRDTFRMESLGNYNNLLLSIYTLYAASISCSILTLFIEYLYNYHLNRQNVVNPWCRKRCN
jgi:hypothetical protein